MAENPIAAGVQQAVERQARLVTFDVSTGELHEPAEPVVEETPAAAEEQPRVELEPDKISEAQAVLRRFTREIKQVLTT